MANLLIWYFINFNRWVGRRTLVQWSSKSLQKFYSALSRRILWWDNLPSISARFYDSRWWSNWNWKRYDEVWQNFWYFGGGESIYGKPFLDEFHQRLKFVHRGMVAMVIYRNCDLCLIMKRQMPAQMIMEVNFLSHLMLAVG